MAIIREISEDDFDGLMSLYMQFHNNSFPKRTEYVESVWEQILNDKCHHIIVA